MRQALFCKNLTKKKQLRRIIIVAHNIDKSMIQKLNNELLNLNIL